MSNLVKWSYDFFIIERSKIFNNKNKLYIKYSSGREVDPTNINWFLRPYENVT